MNTPIPTIVPIKGKDQALLHINNYSDSEVTRVVDEAFKAANIQPDTAPNGQPSRGGWWEWSIDMKAVIIHPYSN